MKFTEEQLVAYSKPLSETEEQQCKNAIAMVVDALKKLGFKEENQITKKYSETPSFQVKMKSAQDGYEVNIFLQGSYAKNTNVRTHSDVDIAVVQEDVFRPKYRPGVTGADYGFANALPRAKSFKDVVQEALIKKFGKDVERCNKSIKIHGNTYRKDADSVPALRFRNYQQDYINDSDNYIGGILIKPDEGVEIINYPEQHLRNGIEKNKSTNYSFKKMVRIAKEMRYQMEDRGYKYAKKASSFGVECLVWNVPDDIFTKYQLIGFKFEEIVTYLYSNRNSILIFKEVNGIKNLCDDDVERRDIYIGFVEELKRFFEYEY
ncbi:MAG: nucleotidyltransferase [Tissierellia bacterium]|nr:nucleotidyltransferase [Tissierellia bacterium]